MRAWLWFFLKLGVVISALHFWGNLNWPASVILGYAVVIALTENPKAANAFTPFTFTLHPHVRAMLLDLGYIDEQTLNAIQIDDYSDPWSAAYMDRFGITGYALQMGQMSGDFMPIVHWPQLKWITSGIGFGRRLEFMDPNKNSFLSDVPACFCRLGDGATLAFGLSVKEKWWKANADRITASGIVLKVESKWHFGTVDLTLATLPPEALYWYCGPQRVHDLAAFERQEQRLREVLQEKNWQEKDRSNDEPWMRSPTVYEHRYVTVYMNDLDSPWTNR